MNFFGSLISVPPRVDHTGSIVTTSDPDTIVEQAISSLLRTRQGERVMMPDYGIPDFVFSVIDSTFKVRIADALEQPG